MGEPSADGGPERQQMADDKPVGDESERSHQELDRIIAQRPGNPTLRLHRINTKDRHRFDRKGIASAKQRKRRREGERKEEGRVARRADQAGKAGAFHQARLRNWLKTAMSRSWPTRNAVPEAMAMRGVAAQIDSTMATPNST